MSARTAALGGNNLAVWDNDINLLHSNPALLNAGMHNQYALNYCNYVSNMNFGYIAHARHIENYGTFGASLNFFDYGKFKGYDEFGQETRNFRANDFCLNLNYALPLPEDTSFNIGIGLKTIYSQYEAYNAFASALDLGAIYRFKNQFNLSIAAKNIGVVWKEYVQNSPYETKLPQTVQLGISKKLSKAPIRLSLVYDHLLRWNLKYISAMDTAGQSNPFGETAVKDSTRFQKFYERLGNRTDNFLRHLSGGVEIMVSKNLLLMAGFNYRRQREFSLPERRGANGFSFGFQYQVKKFCLTYSYSQMALAGRSSILGVMYRL